MKPPDCYTKIRKKATQNWGGHIYGVPYQYEKPLVHPPPLPIS